MTAWTVIIAGSAIAAVGLAFYLGVQAAFRRTDQKLVLANARLVELLKQRKEQWETVFDTITDGIAVLTEKHEVQRGNRALLDMIGSSETGVHLCEALFATPLHMHDLLTTVAETRTRHTMTAPSRRGSRLLRVTVSPMREQGGRRGRMLVVVEDVTERRAMQGRLIHNERMAAVGQLASGVAHELNNPLTSIGGLAELLVARQSLKGRDLEHLTVINEQATRAKKIVRNLLSFARPGPDEITDIDVSVLSRRAVQLMEYELRLRQVALETNYAERLPIVRGDKHQLQQVIINLLTNALHAAEQNSETRSPAVRIETGLDGDTVFVRVSDSGTGIPANAIKSVFTPFYSTKDTGKGTGLGLSISYGIVKGHGGALTIEETGPDGTSFRIELPIPDVGHAVAPNTATDSQEPLPQAPAATVLLVDDDPAIRRTIETLFSGQHQHVDAVANANQAIEILNARADGYDLIIADPRATTGHGQVFAERIVERWPGLRQKTIFVTGDVRPETARWLEQMGCRALTKPFSIRELLKIATELMSGKAAEPN